MILDEDMLDSTIIALYDRDSHYSICSLCHSQNDCPDTSPTAPPTKMLSLDLESTSEHISTSLEYQEIQIIEQDLVTHS